MSEAALRSPRARSLRVFLAGAAPELRRIAIAAGHAVAAAPEDADVILSRAGDGSLVLEAGAGEPGEAGRLAAEATPAQIDAAIRAVAAGLIVRAPGAPEPGFGRLDDTDLERLLTPREIEVLAALGQGLTNKAIARRLDISLHTVKFHVEAIFRKLGVRTRAAAAARATRLSETQAAVL